jgi:aerobic-type carbon monoxide dehydrogenase small subunit (CoxS/CutS family)
VEGLASEDGSLHPVQAAFVKHGVPQCGFCIPGMIVRAEALLRAHPHPDEKQVREALHPHLCRCGTHMRILRAVMKAAAT